MHVLFDSAVPILEFYSTDIFTHGQKHECTGLCTAAVLRLAKDLNHLEVH